MYIRYSIIINGSYLMKLAVSQIQTNLLLSYSDFEQEDDFGMIEFQHQTEFSIYYNREYELEFVNFFHNNYFTLKNNGADKFSIFMEIYYSDQCNFEIFDSKLLTSLSKYEISFPVSVYYVPPKDNYIENLL